MINIDPIKMRLVFGNLFSNAVKFTPRGGRIDVTYKLQVSKANPKNNVMIISVKDSGAGLTAENISHLFEEGVQFNAGKLQNGGGSGFGLYIAKAIVALHNGSGKY